MVGTVEGATVSVRALSIPGLFVLETPVHADERGLFREWFRVDELAAAGVTFSVAQANLSRSARNVVRGLHYSLASDGQAKVVTCVQGELDDVVVDIRLGSPTFGHVEIIELDEKAGVAVVVPPGVAHGFVVTTETATLAYLLSSRYEPASEFEINPFDADIAVPWRLSGPAVMSAKDAGAPSLAARRDNDQLAHFLG